jgi:phosphatidylcholine synthase
VIAAWLAHLYTATGAVLAFLAATAAIEGRYQAAFFWLAVQVFVDATDGVLARTQGSGCRGSMARSSTTSSTI